MKINIVTTTESWALRNIAENYEKNIPNCTVSYFVPDDKSDVNFYINYGLWTGKGPGLDVVYFTHRELNDKILQDQFDKAAKECDLCVSMCENTSKHLDPQKTITSHPGADSIFHRGPIKIGIVGREYVSGRKRWEWIEELHSIKGITLKIADGKYPHRYMPSFYDSIDYLLILSDNEGGPLPLYEAMSMGVPVISSRVGGAESYTVHLYNTYEELEKLLKGLVIHNNKYATESERLLERIKGLL